MDFDTVHRENVVLYSQIFEENTYVPQINEGFSSLSHHQVHGHHHIDQQFAMEGFGYKPRSILCSSFYDPFDPFQASFGKSNLEFAAFTQNGGIAANGGNLMHDAPTSRSIEFGSRVSSQRTEHHGYDQMNEPLTDFQKMNELNYIAKIGNEGGEMSNLILHDKGENTKSNDGKHKAKESVHARTKRVVDKKSEIVKGQWTPEEDGLLVELVEKHGVRKWSSIAKMLPGRIGKQCRERWHNHLKPDIKKDRWSEEEDRILIEAHLQLGNKWAEIARSLPGRSENTIKNHWNATKRRQLSSRSRNNNDSKSSSPLQNYIRSLLMSKSKEKVVLDNTSPSASNSSPSAPKKKTVHTPQVDGFSKLNILDSGVGDERFSKLMESSNSLDADQNINMQLDLQREMDFMEMLSYDYI